ncbi:amino acid transporter ANT1-like protein [Dinothrombium tinctorium]|uniref:Amino acid transporter ANT1-like protein n=1 Tax=Dinothrombium tinctorium TaxID=1965070 RepID=A0A3S3P0E4_9ACAR|nr:amino acid transporter ANT1-like protein [Dinothrombium tinctorium]RWS12748.1 amino acid transporter ANT1-like protein [Dinothrombium tinctorium]
MSLNKDYKCTYNSLVADNCSDTQQLTSTSRSTSIEDAPVHEIRGLSLVSASVFIVGAMAGAGVLALPKAIANTGWAGIALIVVTCFVTASFCVYLAKSWMLVEEIWPECRNSIRDPFPTIGEKAVGKWMKNVCAATMDVQLFGTAIVFLLLSAELTHNIVRPYFDITFCDFIVIIGVILCPLTWLKSPHHFWPVAYGAMACTAISCVLIVAVIVMQSPEKIEMATHSIPTFNSFLLGFSTMLFAFGGICALPTFQNDMKNKQQFPVAVIIGFLILLIIYYPLAVGGFLVYGDKVDDNVLNTTQNGTITTIVNVLMDFHLFCAFLIVVNPLNQDLEQRFGIDHFFTWKRITLRTLTVITILFFGTSVPRFGKILNLVGSSTVAVQTFVMPPWFYLKLCNYDAPNFKKIRISMKLKLYFGIVLVLGSIGGILSTYSSLLDLFDPDAFTLPCYMIKGKIDN